MSDVAGHAADAVRECSTAFVGFRRGMTLLVTAVVLAAVALWFEKYKDVLPTNWQRVEAVRHALFASAKLQHVERFGNGVLQAYDALAITPEPPVSLMGPCSLSPRRQRNAEARGWLSFCSGRSRLGEEGDELRAMTLAQGQHDGAGTGEVRRNGFECCNDRFTRRHLSETQWGHRHRGRQFQ